MSEEQEPLDPEVIQELRSLQAAGNSGFLKDLIDLFLSHGAETFAELREALSREDAADLLRLTHTLRGSSGCLGATFLSGLFGAWEDEIRAGAWKPSPARIREIEAEFVRVRAALEAERDR
jgi:HPt (histidine-containing phosphotransfer) domain-containing protein